MNYTEILYEHQGAVATLTLNRPEQLNPMTRLIVSETIDALGEANADRSVRAVIIRRRSSVLRRGRHRAARGGRR